MTLKQLVNIYLKKGFSLQQARYNAAQEVFVKTITKTKLKETVIFKGGVVLFNLSKSIRRTTSDIDIDLVRFDISLDENINRFVSFLNYQQSISFEVIGEIKTLHHEDYKGKRINLRIEDDTYAIDIKIDIGIHTLFAIKQSTMLIDFSDSSNSYLININPIEQMISEKLLSLSKIGVVTTRYKDIYDIYYLLTNNKVQRDVLLTCVKLLSNNDVDSLINDALFVLSDKRFVKRLIKSKTNWLGGVDDATVVDTITSFLLKI